MGRGKRRGALVAGSPRGASLEGDLADALAAHLAVPKEEVAKLLTTPPKPELGDVALPVHALARRLGRDVPGLARELGQAAKGLDFVDDAEAMGPFVNVRLAASALSERVFGLVEKSRRKKGGLLAGKEGAGETLVLDYSSPNAARKLAFHHLRGTVVGEALARLYEARSYSVKRINHLGDFGVNIGLLMHKLAGSPDAGADSVAPERLQELYVLANQEAEEDPAVKASAYRWLKRLGDEEPEAMRLWRLISDASRAELERTYRRLGIYFDEYRGESRYVGAAHQVADELLRMGVAQTNEEGTIFVPGDESRNLRPIVLVTREGLTTYESRDLAAALERYEDFAYARSVYLTDVGQRARFEAVFEALRESESPAGEGLEHVGFGQMRLKGRKAKTREGTAVPLDEVLDEAEERAREVLKDRLSELEDPDAVARQVGVGAVVFSQVKMRRTTDFDFDLESAVSLEGQTAPRIQYSYARIQSICARAGITPNEALKAGDPQLLSHPLERQLLLRIRALPDAAATALEAQDPSHVAEALLELTEAWASYQTAGARDRSLRVLNDDEDLRAARLKLAAAVGFALSDGLTVLGVECPKRM